MQYTHAWYTVESFVFAVINFTRSLRHLINSSTLYDHHYNPSINHSSPHFWKKTKYIWERWKTENITQWSWNNESLLKGFWQVQNINMPLPSWSLSLDFDLKFDFPFLIAKSPSVVKNMCFHFQLLMINSLAEQVLPLIVPSQFARL